MELDLPLDLSPFRGSCHHYMRLSPDLTQLYASATGLLTVKHARLTTCHSCINQSRDSLRLYINALNNKCSVSRMAVPGRVPCVYNCDRSSAGQKYFTPSPTRRACVLKQNTLELIIHWNRYMSIYSLHHLLCNQPSFLYISPVLDFPGV